MITILRPYKKPILSQMQKEIDNIFFFEKGVLIIAELNVRGGKSGGEIILSHTSKYRNLVFKKYMSYYLTKRSRKS